MPKKYIIAEKEFAGDVRGTLANKKKSQMENVYFAESLLKKLFMLD